MTRVAVGTISAGFIATIALVAVPAYLSRTRREKTTEATINLRLLFEAASAYYERERRGPDGARTRACIVDPAATPNIPGVDNQTLSASEMPRSFVALGFAPPDPLYYRYEIISTQSRCNQQPGLPIYTFRARGDLDGDGIQSTFELAVGVSERNELFRAPGFYIFNELE